MPTMPTGLGSLVTVANVAFAIVLIVALVRAEVSAVAAVISGAVYFTASTTLSLLTLTGSLTEIVTHRQTQVTERQRIRLYQAAQLMPPMPATTTMLPPLDEETPPPHLPSYVPAADLTTRKDAVLWALGLYGHDGQADPDKVWLTSDKEAPGRLRIAAPTNAEVKAWLLQKKVLEKIPGGYRLAIRHYPTADHVRGLLS